MDTQTEFPWRESAEEATSAAISKSGRSFKEVAHHLRPSLKIESAYAWLKAALGDKREKLTFDEHLEIARFVDQYDVLAYACTETHHSQPERITEDDEKAQLQRDYIASVRKLEQISKRLTIFKGAA